MIKEPEIIKVPITVETAHQFFNKRQMAFIVKMKSVPILLLFSTLAFSQTQYKTIVVIIRVLPTTTVDLVANKKYASDLESLKYNQLNK